MNAIDRISLGLVQALTFAAAVGLTRPAAAQEQSKLGVAEVKVAPTLVEDVKKAARQDSLGRVIETIDGQLIDRLHNTRKFEVIARSDLDALFKEQGFSAIGVDEDDRSNPQPFKIAALNYLVLVSVDDFQDFIEVATFEGLGQKAQKRQVRLGAVAKLYDTTTGSLLESANVVVEPKDIAKIRDYSRQNDDLSDRLLRDAAQLMAHRIANRVIDVIYPAKVLAVAGEQVTLNRGDGTGIAKGQRWEVFHVGEELIDPDTGVSLGSEEVKVGVIEILAVTPKFSRARVVEDLGIEKLHVARQVESEE